jgi:lipopolysaccharide biosynthesis glycosyltransferase
LAAASAGRFNITRKLLPSMDIALFVDRNMLPGLHVTIYSCLLNYDGQSKPRFHVFYEQLGDSDLSALRRTLDKTGKNYQLVVHKFVPRLEGLRSLHGNFMTYGRIFLPQLLPTCERVLYLDSDLIVCCDVSPLGNVSFNGFPIAAVSGGRFETALEREFFMELGFDLTVPCFNAGVLLLDLKLWRQQDLTTACLEFGAAYSTKLRAADQTLLNAFFYQRFQPLSTKFNRPVGPMDPPITQEESVIYHFVGSPKPFDLFGEHLHNSSEVFNHYLAKTAVAYRRKANLSLLLRTPRIGRSIWRVAQARWFRRS